MASRPIRFTAQNQAPTAVLSADITSGTAPLTVSFDGSASSDPDPGDTLTYLWDFGDGTPPIEITNATAMHEYSTAGTFTATLTVRDDHGATSAAATLQISVSNSLSTPQNVTSPTVEGTPRVGQTLTANNGTWTGSEPLEFSYQWLRCSTTAASCVPIVAATGSTYTLAPADFGSTIRVAVTATNPAGTASSTSAPTTRVKHGCSGTRCSR